MRVSEELVSERRLRLKVETEHSGCAEQIDDYRNQCVQLKSGLETLKAQLEEHQWSTAAATTHAAAGGGGSLLRKTQLKLASVKAQRNTLMSAETKAFEDLSVVRSQLREREESLDRLRAKSKTLLSRSVIKSNVVSRRFQLKREETNAYN